jgi:ribonuclease P/MRP protein subunit RPP40
VQTTRVVLPDELYQIIGQNVVGPQTEYAKVVMKLEDLLEGDFFTEYIKRGRSASPEVVMIMQ